MSDILEPRKRSADPKEIARQELLRKQELEDLKAVMQTAQGRRLVWRLLSECHIFELSFTGNSETFFREGKRSIGLVFFRDLHVTCPELYRQMESEQQRKEV